MENPNDYNYYAVEFIYILNYLMANKINLDEKIFIAGANGMAGSAIYRALRQKGYGQKQNQGSLLIPGREELDLLDLKAVHDWFEKNQPTVVIVAAAKVGGIFANSTQPADFLLENLKIQTNIIETAFDNGVKRLLFLGSSCIYPKFSKQPIKEEYLLTGELEPTNEWYAIAKIAGIKLCEALRHQHGFDAICLMPTNLYGPGDNYHPTNSHVLPALIRRFCEATEKSLPSVTCWGSGSPLREFMHVDDLGEACVFALERFDPSIKAISTINNDLLSKELIYLNVGTGKDLTIKKLSEKIASASGYKGEINWDKSKPDGTHQKQLDVSRINSIGWNARITLDEGIYDTINYFRNNLQKNSIRL